MKLGATIREPTEQTNTTIDITDDNVKIAAVNTADGEEAKHRVEWLTAVPEVGKNYDGKVVKLMDFGAFVEYMKVKKAWFMCHKLPIIALKKSKTIFKKVKLKGVKLIEVDRQGRVRLSIKQADPTEESASEESASKEVDSNG